MDTYRARDLMRKIAEATHVCGDPGMQFDTTINDWHTCPNTARINASNPCSEYMFLDDSACNLASLNLMKFLRENPKVAGGTEFDVEAFRAAVRTMITAQEILVDNASYPTKAIEKNSHEYRPLGLGYANLGALLMSRGLPYDSDAGRDYAATITAIMHGEAYAQSARIARDHGGPFAGYEKNREPFLRVIRKHRAGAQGRGPDQRPARLYDAARQTWDEAVELGEDHGYRNAQVTVLAPTGTIGFMMDCDTTGVEPDIALVKYKKLVGGGLMKIVNNTVPMALARLGYTRDEVKEIVAHIDEHETIEGAPHLKDKHLPVFDCAFKPAKGQRSIHYMGHIKMIGAVQPFISGAISKTVNVPKDCTVEDIEQAYIDAWRLGVKAVAIYRDGCKRTQPLNTSRDKKIRPPPASRRASRSAASCPTSAARSPTSSTSPATRATSPSASTRTAHPARSSSSWRRRARRSPASPTPSPGHLLRAAVRRAAAGSGGQVQPRAVRAGRHDQEPGHALRQVDRRLHLPVDGGEVPLARGAGTPPA